jgi:hypothetical protein
MSKFPQNMNGGSRGRLGNVIFSSWKGIEYVRSKPEKVYNPRTPAQVAQRTKFSMINSIITPLIPFIRIGFSGYAERMSAYNAAISYNLQQAITGNPLYPEIDFEKLTFSRGLYPGVAEATCNLIGKHSLQFTWDAESIAPGSDSNDRILAIVYNQTKNASLYVPHLASRTKGTASLDLSSVSEGDIIHCYLSVIDTLKASSNKPKLGISNSCYLGKLIIE